MLFMVFLISCEQSYKVTQINRSSEKMEIPKETESDNSNADDSADDGDDGDSDESVVQPAAPHQPQISPPEARIFGKVKDALTGEGIENVKVFVKGQLQSSTGIRIISSSEIGDYNFDHLTAGTYLLSFEAENYIAVYDRVVVLSAGQSRQENLAMTGILADNEIRVTMTWTREKSSAVKDVDSYLAISGVQWPLGYFQRGHEYYGTFLDRDDRDWMGPETITIRSVDLDKSYTYYVNNYSVRTEKSFLGNSEVQVSVYMGDHLLKEYKVPQGQGNTYQLFKIENGVLVDYAGYDESLIVYGPL
jgi:hypothetical protein